MSTMGLQSWQFEGLLSVVKERLSTSESMVILYVFKRDEIAEMARLFWRGKRKVGLVQL